MMYDLAILGGGPAGYSAAFEAVRHHMSVVLFERGRMGGTCLNRGCVPTKYLSHMARRYYELKNGMEEGILFSSMRLEYEKVCDRMTKLISSLRKGLEDKLHADGVCIVYGDAMIKSQSRIACNGKEYSVKNILIATGSDPEEPIIESALTSDEILKLQKIPEHLHIVGGGTIAVEFAEIFKMLGSDVTISIRADRILRNWDREIALGLMQSMKKKGIRIHKKTDFSDFHARSDEVVFCAVGRRAVLPEVSGDFYHVGKNGGIEVTEYGQTKTEGIFAAGDVKEKSSRLAHIGMEEGRQVVRYIAGERIKNTSVVVRCLYPDQEAASVGITEADAGEQGIEVVSAKQTMFSNARTLISTKERGFVKILADRQSRKLIGAHLLCERAGEIITELSLAVQIGLTVQEMLHMVRPHPGYAEAVTDALRLLEEKMNAF